MTRPWQRLLALTLRDAAVIGATVALWSVVGDTTGSGAAAIALAILAALLTALCGFLLHEWGHLLGALAARSVVALPASPFASPFLFRFDVGRNDGRQFCAMSLGGFIASVLAVLGLVWILPPGRLATLLTLALVALGVIATFILEVPEFLRVWRGGPLPRGAAYVSGSKSESAR